MFRRNDEKRRDEVNGRERRGLRKGNRQKRGRPSKDLSDVITALRPIDCFCRSGSAVISSSPCSSFLFSPVHSFPPLHSSLLTSSLSERERERVMSLPAFLSLFCPLLSCQSFMEVVAVSFVRWNSFIFLIHSMDWLFAFCQAHVHGVEDLCG